MRIQQTTRLITISVVMLSGFAILCALMAHQVRFSLQLAYQCRSDLAASEDLSL